MAFNSEQKTISSKLLASVLYVVPRNQRNYVWQEKNWAELWNDVLFTSENEQSAHFIGSVVLMDNGEKEGIQYYDIIDGQQRITTLLLFVSAIMQVYKEKNENNLYSGLKRFLLSTDLQSKEHCKVQSEYQPAVERIVDQVACSDANYDEIIRVPYEANDAIIINCFSYFFLRLKDLDLEEVKRIQLSLLKINYIDITATTSEDSYTIFEILNARGLALEDSELLKNYIMRYSLPKSEIDRIRQDWVNLVEKNLGDGLNRFFIHYVRHKYKTSGNKISPYAVIKENNSAATISTLFADIKLKAKYYKKIINPVRESDGGNCSKIEYRVFKFLKAYRGELFRPLLLSLMHVKESGQLSETNYDKLLVFFQYYFTCYNLISQETSNKISGGVQKYAFLIENSFEKNQIPELVAFLVQRLPSKKEFSKSFGTLGWSHVDPAYEDSSNKRKVQIALSTIEYIKTNNSYIEDFTIEHILPDSELNGNALIGNLLPLEESINNNCKDKDFASKIEYYKQSNFRSVRDFVDNVKVDDFDPKGRASNMASIIYDQLKNTTKSIK